MRNTILTIKHKVSDCEKNAQERYKFKIRNNTKNELINKNHNISVSQT